MNMPKEYKKLQFSLDPDTGRYLNISCPIGFNSVPRELKAEERKADQIKTDLIIRSLDKEPHSFFTGLIPTQYRNIYFGDHFNRKSRSGVKKSLVVFKFTPDSQLFTLLYFPGYYPRFNAPEIVRDIVNRGMI